MGLTRRWSRRFADEALGRGWSEARAFGCEGKASEPLEVERGHPGDRGRPEQVRCEVDILRGDGGARTTGRYDEPPGDFGLAGSERPTPAVGLLTTAPSGATLRSRYDGRRPGSANMVPYPGSDDSVPGRESEPPRPFGGERGDVEAWGRETEAWTLDR